MISQNATPSRPLKSFGSSSGREFEYVRRKNRPEREGCSRRLWGSVGFMAEIYHYSLGIVS
jgi:hypothetical protein